MTNKHKAPFSKLEWDRFRDDVAGALDDDLVTCNFLNAMMDRLEKGFYRAEDDDQRYPYTYACDLIRRVAGHDQDGTKLSRSDASRIRMLVTQVLGMRDHELAKRLADYYLSNTGTEE